MSSEASNGYLNDADAGLLSWNALEEEPDSSSAHDASVTADTESQRSLLLSHTEALAGTGHKHIAGSCDHDRRLSP